MDWQKLDTIPKDRPVMLAGPKDLANIRAELAKLNPQ
jgi:hypothetical protein